MLIARRDFFVKVEIQKVSVCLVSRPYVDSPQAEILTPIAQLRAQASVLTRSIDMLVRKGYFTLVTYIQPLLLPVTPKATR